MLMLSATAAGAQSRPLPPPPPARAQAAAPSAPPLQPLLLTQLDEHAPAPDLDNHLVTLSLQQPVGVRELLLQLVRDTSLSVVPGPSVSGAFVGELKNVTVRQALTLVLPPLGLDYSADGTFIRVFRRPRETRIFDLNYVATTRTGVAQVGTNMQGTSSGAHLTTGSGADVFAELAHGVQGLVSERGTFNVDRRAGILQVTDAPDRLDRIAAYLDSVQERAQRQVQIDVRVVEVELSDARAAGIDWDAVAQSASPDATGRRRAMAGLRVTDVSKLLSSLEAQGTVAMLASPRLLTLNNEPAIVRSADSSGADSRSNASSGTSSAVVLSVTPQVGGDGVITLSLTPLVTIHGGANEQGTTSVRESDTLARVADGETVVVAGFPRDREVNVQGRRPKSKDAPVRKRVELVILLTPRVVGSMAQP